MDYNHGSLLRLQTVLVFVETQSPQIHAILAVCLSWSQACRSIPDQCLHPWPYYISRVHDDVIKWKHYPRYWPFMRGIHRSLVNSPHKGQWRAALMFSLICVWINGWVNNREAGDLRRYRAHYDVIVMNFGIKMVLAPLFTTPESPMTSKNKGNVYNQSHRLLLCTPLGVHNW